MGIAQTLAVHTLRSNWLLSTLPYRIAFRWGLSLFEATDGWVRHGTLVLGCGRPAALGGHPEASPGSRLAWVERFRSRPRPPGPLETVSSLLGTRTHAGSYFTIDDRRFRCLSFPHTAVVRAVRPLLLPVLHRYWPDEVPERA